VTTVYGIQEPPPFYNRKTGNHGEKDLSSAQRYGKVVFLLTRQDKPATLPGPCHRKLAQGLKNFRPDDFLFFPGGDFLALLQTGGILRDMGFRKVQYLKWEKERDTDGKQKDGGFYMPVEVML